MQNPTLECNRLRGKNFDLLFLVKESLIFLCSDWSRLEWTTEAAGKRSRAALLSNCCTFCSARVPVNYWEWPTGLCQSCDLGWEIVMRKLSFVAVWGFRLRLLLMRYRFKLKESRFSRQSGSWMESFPIKDSWCVLLQNTNLFSVESADANMTHQVQHLGIMRQFSRWLRCCCEVLHFKSLWLRPNCPRSALIQCIRIIAIYFFYLFDDFGWFILHFSIMQGCLHDIPWLCLWRWFFFI